jgi:cytochrome c
VRDLDRQAARGKDRRQLLAYATTLFNYARRAMLNAPRALTDDGVYALSAFILRLNSIIGDSEVMSIQPLPQVHMPNRDGFVPFTHSQ